jgi:hypothetical protein
MRIVPTGADADAHSTLGGRLVTSLRPQRLRGPDAVGMARTHFDQQGWPWVEPVRVITTATNIMVTTDCFQLREAGVVWINRADSRVVRAQWIGDFRSSPQVG